MQHTIKVGQTVFVANEKGIWNDTKSVGLPINSVVTVDHIYPDFNVLVSHHVGCFTVASTDLSATAIREHCEND
jgi:hypothetical protein